jgi:predicted ATPase with chaperone activity
MQVEHCMGRIDLRIEVPAVPFQELSASTDGNSSALVRQQVSKAFRYSGNASESTAVVETINDRSLDRKPWAR